jgi:hypothetical protein
LNSIYGNTCARKKYMPLLEVRSDIRAFFPNKPHKTQEIFENYVSLIKKKQQIVDA